MNLHAAVSETADEFRNRVQTLVDDNGIETAAEVLGVVPNTVRRILRSERITRVAHNAIVPVLDRINGSSAR